MQDTFILHMRYKDILNQLTDTQAGKLIKAVFDYKATGHLSQWEDNSLAMAFLFIRQDLDYNQQKYTEICAKRAQNGRKGGQRKKSQTSNCLPTAETPALSKSKHNDKDKGNDKDKNISLSVPLNEGERERESFSGENKNPLPAEFVDQVIAQFESAVKTPVQRRIFVKNNAQSLKDILEFCDHDIQLALQTISVCADRLAKGGVTGGYAAVCRNLPEYYEKAKIELAQQRYD